MSLYRLQNFLKENAHDVIDYWVQDSMVKYVRVISRKNGFIFFVRLGTLKVSMPNHKELDLSKTNFYILEPDHEDHESLDILYDVFLCAFPEHQYKYLLFEGYYLLQEKDVCFQIKNLSDTQYFGFYLMLDIEWFYENIFIINHEIEKRYLDIQTKIEKMYLGFIPQYETFQQHTDVHKMDHVFQEYKKYMKWMEKCKELFLKVCKNENKTIHDIQYNEKIFDSDDLMFHETVKRSFQKKKLNEQLDQYLHLRKQCIDKIIFYHCILWKVLIRFLVLMTKFTKLQSEFHAMVHEIEHLLPKNHLF